MSTHSRPGGEFLWFRWSHRHPLHLALVRLYNAVMRFVPLRLKYGVGLLRRRSKPPYDLLRDDSVVVQVGAPRDTLRAGRSRAIYFALLTRRAGQTVVVEPDADNVAVFDGVAARLGLGRVRSCPVAAWCERTTLDLRVKSSHPAAGFVEGCADYSPQEIESFAAISVAADTLDNILESLAVERVDLLSLTTNGAERQILAGAGRQLARGIRYISLARTGEGYRELMHSLGYRFLAYDDRGFTFEKRNGS